MSEYNSYREAGYQARNDGDPVGSCPYSGGPEADAWREGWQDADSGAVVGTQDAPTATPHHITDEETYEQKPTLDPRMTHVAKTQAEEEAEDPPPDPPPEEPPP